MPSVLFVCTANRFRSPLAAALLMKSLRDREIDQSWQVSSAGTWAIAGQPALPEVCEAAQQWGLDLSKHRSARVTPPLLAKHDLILAMQAGQKEALVSEDPKLEERVYLLSHVSERRSYDIPDTFGSEQEILEVIAELASLIQRGFESICVLATYLNNTRRRSAPDDGKLSGIL